MTCIDLSKTVLAIYCEQVVSSLRATSSKEEPSRGSREARGGGGGRKEVFVYLPDSLGKERGKEQKGKKETALNLNNLNLVIP